MMLESSPVTAALTTRAALDIRIAIARGRQSPNAGMTMIRNATLQGDWRERLTPCVAYRATQARKIVEQEGKL
ncbi:hypothetical protein JI59_08505 [Novosphingobium pentaromativorans US6-1]|nr:hypothetical protein JI59_08505 [Novosphingobium pentaromativorans US6-1]